jgi:hypothetical protein
MGRLSLGKTMNNETRDLIKHMLLGLSAVLLFVIIINGLAYILVHKTQVEIDHEVNYVTHMKASDAESVLAIINAEGFDNAFNHYSSYRDINDMKFHDLRKAYIAASRELKEYLEECAGKMHSVSYYLSYESRD